ncbi:MAG TPA: hypothetical protein VIO94_16000 [Phenylobacterium sp.]
MAAGRIVIPGLMPAEDHNGDRIPGALLYFYENETVTMKSVYTTDALDVAHTNPVVANDVGVFPPMWSDNDELYSIAGTEADGTPLPGINYDGVSSSKEATLASADLAEAAQVAAETARDETVAISDKFGDVDAAITAAQAAQAAAETAETNAETAETNAETARDAALVAQAAAEQAAADAEAIAGFDPTPYLRTDAAQSFTDGAKAQGRANIGAQPELGAVDRQKVATASIVAGVLTLDASAASVYAVSWDANITSLVITGWAAGTDQQTISLWLIGAGGSSYAFGAAYKPLNNTSPTLDTTSGAENLLHFTTRNAGTRICFSASGYFPA